MNRNNPDNSLSSIPFLEDPRKEVVRNFGNKSRTELCKSTCLVCHLVGHLINPVSSSRASPNSQDPGNLFPNARLETWGPGEKCSDEFPSVKLAVRSPATGSTRIMGDDRDYIRFIMACRSTDDGKADVRELNPSEISFDFFKAKLTECLNNHRKCQSTEAEVEGLRVINVDTEEIEDAPKNCDYMALSYVWGPTSSCQCMKENFRPVVQDAITVTKRLGWKYLWVDQHVSHHDHGRIVPIDT